MLMGDTGEGMQGQQLRSDQRYLEGGPIQPLQSEGLWGFLLKGLQAAKLKAPVKSYAHPNRKLNKQPPGGLQTLDSFHIWVTGMQTQDGALPISSCPSRYPIL